MTKALILAVALALLPTAGLAETFHLTVKNGYTDALTGLSIAGGKIEAFKQIPANGKRTFAVTLADGKCQANISMNFANGQHYDAGKFDFCKNDILDLWFQ